MNDSQQRPGKHRQPYGTGLALGRIDKWRYPQMPERSVIPASTKNGGRKSESNPARQWPYIAMLAAICGLCASSQLQTHAADTLANNDTFSTWHNVPLVLSAKQLLWNDSVGSSNGPNTNLTLISLSSISAATGTLIGKRGWTNLFNGPMNNSDTATAIAVDKEGSVLITGTTIGLSTKKDYATIKYHPDGTPAWTNYFSSAGYADDLTKVFALDSGGNCYVSGTSPGPNGDMDCITIKYAPDGSPCWTNAFSGPPGANDYPIAMVTDQNTNLLVSCFAGSDYAIVKYAASGLPTWTNMSRWKCVALVLDNNGSAHVTGSVSASPGTDIATIKYNATGSIVWSNSYNGSGLETSAGIALDIFGDVYVTGRTLGATTGMDFVTLKYRSNGLPLWTNIFNSVSNQTDSAISISVDGFGAVLVTGLSVSTGTGTDYITIKYLANGTAVWTNRYTSPGAKSDIPVGLTVDPFGNVHVLGSSVIASNTDYVCVSYRTDGVAIATNTFNGSSTNNDIPIAIASDQSGNVYLTGTTSLNSTNTDYATIKIAAAGIQSITYVPPNDYAGVDSFSYVIQDSLGIRSTGTVALTVRWPPALTIEPQNQTAWIGQAVTLAADAVGYGEILYQWLHAGTNLPGGQYNMLTLTNVQLSDAGEYRVAASNIYGTVTSAVAVLTVHTLTQAMPDTLFTAAALPAQYLAQHLTGNDRASTVNAMRTNLFLVSVAQSSQMGGVIVPLLHSGWTNRFNGFGQANDYATELAVDGEGNAIVTGYSAGTASLYDIITCKYAPSGAPLWTNVFNGGANSNDYPMALAIGPAGDVVVTGYSAKPDANYDYVTILYHADGSPVWTNYYDGPANGRDVARALCVDRFGNVFITGSSYGGSIPAEDYATIKYDSNGVAAWTNRYNGSYSYNDQARALRVDANGNVYVTGVAVGGLGWTDFVTIKYASNGTPLWVQRYDATVYAEDEANALALDADGNVYVTGLSFSRSPGTLATVKYTTDGLLEWSRQYHMSGTAFGTGDAIAVDAQGNIIVAGDWDTGPTNSEYVTIKYKSDGQMLWANRFTVNTNRESSASDLALDSLGNVYVTGAAFGEETAYDFATIKYLADGAVVWTNLYSGPGRFNDYARDVTLDLDGNVFVTGYSVNEATNFDYLTIKIPSDSLVGLTYAPPPNFEGTDSFQYVVRDSYGLLATGLVTIAVGPPLTITAQPQSQVVFAGTTPILSVNTTGNSTARFQWFRNNEALLGQNNSYLMITNAHRSDSGIYHVEIETAYISFKSSNATLRVVSQQRLHTPENGADGMLRLAFGDADNTPVPADAVGNMEVQVTTNLTINSWTTITNSLLLTNGLFRLEVPFLREPGYRFYRVLER